jgi:tape measure domain-containing protein
MSNVMAVEAQFNGNAIGLIQAAEASVAAMKRVQDASYKVGEDVRGIGGKLGEFGSEVGSRFVEAGKKLGEFALRAGEAGVAVATVFAGGAIKAGLTRLGQIQDATDSLTIMLGSATKAADLTAATLKIVQGTPFAFPQFAQATQRLVAFGISADKIPPMLTAIADAAAASGRGSEGVSQLTEAFSKLQSTGKLNYQVIERFATAGVDALGILGNAYGVNKVEAQKMLAKGIIPIGDAMSAITKGIEEGSDGINGSFVKMGGTAQKMGESINGSLENLKTAFARMGASWLKPFQTDLPKTINDGVIPLFDKMGKAGGGLVQKLEDLGVLTKVTEWFGKLTDRVDPTVTAFLKFLPVLSPLKDIFVAFQSVLPQIQAPLEDVGRVVTGSLIPAFANIMVALVPLLPIIGQVADAFARGLVALTPVIVAGINGLVGVIGPLVGILDLMPAPVLAAGAALVILGNAGLPIGGILKLAGGAMMDMATTAMAAAGITGSAADIAFGPWGLAIAAAAVIFGGWAMKQGEIKQNIDSITASLDAQSGAFTNNTKEKVVNMLHDAEAYKSGMALGLSYDTVTAAAMGNVDAQTAVAAAMVTAKEHYDADIATKGVASEETKKLMSASIDLRDKLGEVTGEVIKGTEADQLHAQEMGIVAVAVSAWRTATDAATAALAANGATLDTNTAAGNANMTALGGVADKALGVVAAQQKAGGSTADLSLTMQSNRDMFIQTAQKMGATADEARALADKYGLIPGNVHTNVTADTSDATRKILSMLALYDSVARQTTVVPGRGAGPNGKANGGIVTAHANGAITQAANGLSRTSMLVKGGANILWAEPETGWEAYISGKPGQENRNKDIWAQAGEKLGMFDQKGGGGGHMVQHVSETIQIMLPNGKVLAEFLRDYDRSLK